MEKGTAVENYGGLQTEHLKRSMSPGCFSHFHVTSFRCDACNGAKNSKQRIPGLLCYDAHGTDKLPPSVTGNSPLAPNTHD
jgi:hypothetical protein